MPLVRWRDQDGSLREERTHEPGRVVASVVASFGGEPADLEVIRPSLEDIYLQLVRSVDDAAQPEEVLA